MAAAGRGKLDVVELLIRRGARVGSKRSDASTALIFAAKGGLSSFPLLSLISFSHSYYHTRSVHAKY